MKSRDSRKNENLKETIESRATDEGERKSFQLTEDAFMVRVFKTLSVSGAARYRVFSRRAMDCTIRGNRCLCGGIKVGRGFGTLGKLSGLNGAWTRRGPLHLLQFLSTPQLNCTECALTSL